MRRLNKPGMFSGKGAVVVAATLLFTACLLWFSMLANDDTPLPVILPLTEETAGADTAADADNTDTANVVQAAAPGDWATNLLAIELSGSLNTQKIVKLTANIDDPDWPTEEKQSQQASGSTGIVPIVTTKAGPKIMLYSTHSNESFRMVDAQAYKELTNFNTLDTNYNILRVNKELSTLLADTYHLPIYFCDTDHELGKYYTTSYERSLSSIKKAMETYPTLCVFFDIHRDSAKEGNNSDFVMVNGKACARIMFVVGTGEGKTGTGFAVKPNWKSNLALAELLTEEINRLAPGLCKDVRINTGRYNQHVSDTALAIEVGHNQNTLEEALNAVPYLAQAINNVLTQDLDIQPVSVP